MLIYTVFILSVFLAVKGFFEDEVMTRCDYNITLFEMKGKKAMFHVDNINCSCCIMRFSIVTPDKKTFNEVKICLGGTGVLYYNDRVSYTYLHRDSFNITLTDVVTDDNGMYFFDGFSLSGRSRPRYCWKLFVLDIWSAQGIQTFEEFRPAYIHASPRASRMVRRRVNATATWLLDGLNYLQTTDFLEQDGLLIIISVLRNLDGKNVTYRIVEDNGDVKEVNLTLSVTYEQEMHITLSPDTMVYFLSAGETMPDIVCTVECDTVCNVTWNTLSSTNVLSLGTVTSDMSGEYTCSASWEDSNKTVKRSVIVNVKDEQERHITLSPDTMVYFLSAGETMPDIVCTVEYDTVCNVTWNTLSSTNVLSLGTVTSDMSGEYTCSASWEDSNKTVKRSVIVNVKDEQERHITLSPDTMVYFLSAGETMPDIVCTVEYDTVCNVTWNTLSSTNVLSLGTVTSDMSGEYTCSASWEDSNKTVKRSVIVNVKDEQERHITLSPDTMVYFLSAGETMPDIVCTVECDIVCNVRWNTLSSTNVLSLGTVTSDMSGEYTCSASCKDSNKTVKRSVIVYVKDNTTLIIAAAVLGTVQGVTLICLGICAVYMYRASGRNGTCMTCIAKRANDTTRANMTNLSVQDISTIEMEHTEGLDHTQSGTDAIYEILNIENVA